MSVLSLFVGLIMSTRDRMATLGIANAKLSIDKEDLLTGNYGDIPNAEMRSKTMVDASE